MLLNVEPGKHHVLLSSASTIFCPALIPWQVLDRGIYQHLHAPGWSMISPWEKNVNMGGNYVFQAIHTWIINQGRVAKVAREHGWHPPKSLDSDGARTYAILSRIKICRDLRTFWRSLGKKSAFLGQKQYFLGKKSTIAWYIIIW